METRTLGDTGLIVSRLGLGMAALGRPGYINLGHSADLPEGHDADAMRVCAYDVLDSAYAAGVRYFDAARSYGRAEAFLAHWLKSRGIVPGSVAVGSKWGYTYTAGWKVEAETHEVKNHSLATLTRQAVETRETIGRYLGLYQIHSVTPEGGVLEDRAVLDELARLKRSGWKIGLSLTGPRQAEALERALDVSADGARLFDCVQATWNVLEPSAGRALGRAHEAGMGVIVKEALANGRLTSRNDDPASAEVRRVLDAEADRLGTSPDALALAFALDRPWADVVLSGAATPGQLRSNLGALAVALDEQALAALNALAEPPRVYWETRARLPWN